jgi:hypothetical protein
MKAFNSTINFFTIFLTTLILTACGGGGGDGSHSGGTNVPTAGVSITTNNAKQVGAAAVGSTDTVQGVTAGSGVLTGVSIETSGEASNYSNIILQQLRNLLSQGAFLNSSLTGVLITDVWPCTTGQVNISGNVAVSGELNSGDSLTLTFVNCNDGGVVLTGSMTITFTQISAGFDGNPPFTLGITIQLTNFTANESGQVIVGNGDMSMLMAEDSSGNETFQLSGNSLSATSGGYSEILTSYAYNFQFSASGAYSVTMQGTLASTQINGSVSYTTITPFTGNDFVGTGNPTAGELHITTSADSSQAWLIAQSDGTNVVIDIDTDGDNVVDNTVNTTWTEMENL